MLGHDPPTNQCLDTINTFKGGRGNRGVSGDMAMKEDEGDLELEPTGDVAMKEEEPANEGVSGEDEEADEAAGGDGEDMATSEGVVPKEDGERGDKGGCGV